MKRCFTEERILDFLKQAETGVPVKEVCRRHGFSDASFYTWRAKFGGMTVPEDKWLKDLELENSRLKKLLAEAHPDIDVLMQQPLTLSGAAQFFGIKAAPDELAVLEKVLADVPGRDRGGSSVAEPRDLGGRMLQPRVSVQSSYQALLSAARCISAQLRAGCHEARHGPRVFGIGGFYLDRSAGTGDYADLVSFTQTC